MRSYVQLDEFIVMPNHVHGIIMIMDGGDTVRRIPTAHDVVVYETEIKPKASVLS